MKTITLYLIRQTVAVMGMTVMVFAFALLMGNMMKEILALLVTGHVSFLLISKAFLLLIPFVLVYALPMGMLTATLLLFGRLSADQELTALRASGVSVTRLSLPVIAISLLMSGLCAWINTDIAPKCRAAYKSLIREVDIGQLTDLLQPGIPMTEIPGQVIHIQNRRTQGNQVGLGNIHYIKYDGNKPVMEIYAEGGILEANEETSQLFMSMTNCTIFSLAQSSTSGVDQGNEPSTQTPWHIGKAQELAADPFEIKRDSIGFRKPKLHHMSLAQLREELAERKSLAEDLKALPSFNAEHLRAELESYLIKPFDPVTPVKVQIHRQAAFSYACFAFTLIGIPLGVRAHRRETSIGIGMALLLVAFYYAFIVLANALENQAQFAPHLLIWFPNLFFQLLGSLMLWRIDRR